jgi:WD40 repeat protein
MPHAAWPCDDALLEGLLTGELHAEQQQHLETHLETCGQCRARLDELAADPAEWREIRAELSSVDFVPGASVSELAGGIAGRTTPARGLDIREDLAPTDDPHMLGRLGGYEIAGVIGAGGMGVVLKGFDRALNRFVAIKVLAPHLAASGAARRRFSREARAAAAVVHENVVHIHGVAEANGLPYLVMPYIRGQSLQKRLDECGVLNLVEVLRIGHQIASGLAAAHAQGLVHRDIKPANVLLEDGVERLKITDFGLARAADDVSLTQEGTLAGTPQYMSPEQARGEAVDARSDLFSLGSLLYAACTGRPPFRAESSYGILRRITDSSPPGLRELNPDVQEWLEKIIGKLLAKDPRDRFTSAEEVAELLQGCLAHVQQPNVTALPEQIASFHGTPKARRTRIAWLVGIAAGIVCAAWVGYLAWRGDDTPRQMPAEPSNGGDRVAPAPPAAVASLSLLDPRPLTVPLPPGNVRSIRFSADGRWLAVGCIDDSTFYALRLAPHNFRSGTVQIWDVSERRLLLALSDRYGVSSVAFSPSGEHVAFATMAGMIKVIERRSGEEKFRYALGGSDTVVAFSPGGTYLAATSMNGTVVLFKADSFEKLPVTFEGKPLPLLALTFSADETRLAAAGGVFPPRQIEGAAAVWEVATGRRVMTVTRSAPLMDVAFSPDGQELATACLDNHAYVWDVASGGENKRFADKVGLVRARYLANGTGLATLGPSSGIKLWDLDKRKQLAHLPLDDEVKLAALDVSRDGSLIAVGGTDRLVRLWDPAEQKAVAELNPAVAGEAISPILAMASSSDGKWLAAGREDGVIALRNADNGILIRLIKAHRGPVHALFFSANSKEIVSASDESVVCAWDSLTGERSRTFVGADGAIRSLGMSPDGSRMVAGAESGAVTVWDYATGKPAAAWKAHDRAVNVACFSPDGKKVLSAGADGLAKVWDAGTRALLATCDAHGQPIRAAAFAPSGAVVASAGADGRAVLWDAATGFDRRALGDGMTAIRSLLFAADGKTLWTGGDDRALYVWDTATLQPRQPKLTGHGNAVTALSYIPLQSGRLASAGLDGTIQLWLPGELPRPEARSD